MNEIEKCPLCGKVPGWHDFDIEARIFGGERSYFCCGMKASTAVLWNQYAAAMELARAEVALVGADDRFTEAASTRNAAFLRVLEVFGGE